VPRPLHLLLLRIFRHLPPSIRRIILGAASPSYRVGAICVVRRPDGRLLLVRHSYRDSWGFPGGVLKRNEEPPAGARRETLEEVGLAIDTIGEATVVVAPRSRRVDLIFGCEPAADADPDSASPRSAEILEVRWFARDQLPELQHEAAAGLRALEEREA
jgi:8-oxo-dGTP diphosphatase